MTSHHTRTGAQPWADQGMCAQTDPELFFPEVGGPTGRARAVCAVCPVIAECLEYALAHEEPFGIWGGSTPMQRRRIRQQRRAA